MKTHLLSSCAMIVGLIIGMFIWCRSTEGSRLELPLTVDIIRSIAEGRRAVQKIVIKESGGDPGKNIELNAHSSLLFFKNLLANEGLQQVDLDQIIFSSPIMWSIQIKFVDSQYASNAWCSQDGEWIKVGIPFTHGRHLLYNGPLGKKMLSNIKKY